MCIESHWGVWTGRLGQDDVAVMVAVVTGGYHGVSSYQWAKDDIDIEEDVYPVVYVMTTGIYKCTISTSPGIVLELKFTVACEELYLV